MLDAGPIAVLAERDPKALPWGDLGVDVVIESTGLFTPRRHGRRPPRGRGASGSSSRPRPPTSTPRSWSGVNDDEFDPAKHFVVSNASCTTNCFVPMVKVLDDAFGVENGLMTTVHAYTNDQNLLDLPHKDLRRARAAAVNIVPASTGAARATSLVLRVMKGRLDGAALRVPVPDGSITDFTASSPARSPSSEVNDGLRGRRHVRPAGQGAGLHRGPHRVLRHRRQPGLVHLRRRADHGDAIGLGDHAGQGDRLVRQRVGLLQPPGRPVADRGRRGLSRPAAELDGHEGRRRR